MEGSLTPLAQIAGTLSVPQGVIAPTLQDKTVDITATETAQTETVEKDQGYDGLNEVTINVSAIPSDYVGSGIDRRDETDLTASGATVTVPAGYYEDAETKNIDSGAAATPATSITANPSISLNTETGLITATASASQNVTPNVTPGYVESGTAGAISVSGSSTSQLSVQAGSTITPTESQQTAVAAGKYTIGAVNIGAISSSYVGSGITRRDSDDLTASGATVTAPAGYYGESASKSVASGTEGTPTATKGSVSNHSVSITPSVTNTAGYISGGTKTGTAVTVSASELVSGSQTIDENDTYDVTNLSSVTVNVPTGSTINNQDKSVTPTESAQSVTYDSGYTGLGTVSVGAISSSYVGTGITRRDSDDLSASGATVTAPAGYYGSAASKTIASGTEGTPTATKGNVSNHAISVTPSVTNAAGYISGGTHAGTAVSVSASELVSGTLTVDSSGTKDVTNYASASVPAGTAGTPTATKGTVSNHSVTVTPSVTNSAGWVGSETKTGTAVTVQASELDSGTKSITANGTNQDVVGYAAIDVAVPNSYSAGDEGKVVDDGALVSQTAHADVTPTTSDQTINTTTNNSIKVKGDADLVAGNIKKDVEIFGVTGSYEGSGGGGISADDIASQSISGNLTITETTVKPFAFYGNSGVTSFSSTTVTEVKESAFYGVGSATFDFPNTTTIGNSAFRNATTSKLYFPKVTTLTGSYIFSGSNGGVLALPKLESSIGSDMMRGLSATYVDLGKTPSIGTRGLYQGNGKVVLILRKTDDICALSGGTGALTLANGCNIYVPSSLKATYQSASGWSSLNNVVWNNLEGSIYESEDWAA